MLCLNVWGTDGARKCASSEADPKSLSALPNRAPLQGVRSRAGESANESLRRREHWNAHRIRASDFCAFFIGTRLSTGSQHKVVHPLGMKAPLQPCSVA